MSHTTLLNSNSVSKFQSLSMASSSASVSASDSPKESSTKTTTFPSFPFPTTSDITPEKFNGQNYLSWEGYVLLWFQGQGLDDHLTKKAIEIAEEERDQWMRIDYQLVPLLWHFIDPTLLVHFRSYRSCCDVWNQVRSFYSNDLRRFHDVVGELLELKVRDGDMFGYLNKSLSVAEEVKFFLTCGNVSEKLDTFLMLSVLHGLSNDFESFRNEILMKSEVTTVEGLYNRLLRVIVANRAR